MRLNLPRYARSSLLTWGRLLALVWVWVSLLAGLLIPAAVGAQSSCPGVTIRKDSSSELDETALCTAAQPWTDHGNQVYIFVTDEDASSEDDWFSIRDRVESGWGIYNVSDKTFAKNALAVEVMTETSHAWGQDIAFGEALSGTPLDDDATVSRLEGRLKNRVAAGNITAAIADALTTSYATAFPAQTVAPTDRPTSPTEPSNTGVAGGVGTSGTDEGTSSSGGGGVTAFLSGLFAIIAAIAATPTLILPAIRRRRERKRLLAHLDDLSDTVGSLLYAAKTLFTGETVEETTLWKLFLVYGGDRYTDLTADVRGWTEQSMKALGEVLVLHEDMDHRVPGKSDDDVKAMIRTYEIMYLTLVGTNPAILGMNEEQFKNFIDPLAGGVEPPTEESTLVTQVRDLRRQLAEQPLRAKLEVVDPKELDADGVFGYANRIKTAIGQLIAAQEGAPGKFEAARQARDDAATSTALPAGLDPNVVFGGVDSLLRSAEEESEGERWLYVQAHAEAADALLGRLGQVLPLISTVIAEHQARAGDVAAIAEAGYRLSGLDQARQESAQQVEAIYAHLQAGEIDQVQPALDLLAAQSEAMRSAAQERVALREKNIAELGRLAAEVARVEHVHVAEAEPAFAALQAYSSPNWQDLAQFTVNTTVTLKRLFDAPADPSDLASNIDRQNSMDTQEFDAAEQALADAFGALHEAEEQDKAVVARLAHVRGIEGAAATLVGETTVALEAATSRRDRDDAKIDPTVDQQIHDAAQTLAQGKQALAERSFVAASTALNTSRSLSAAAQAAADEQARQIDALFAELEQTKNLAHASVAASTTELNALVAPAQTEGTKQAVLGAQASLGAAENAAATVAGNEDRALAAALRSVITAYQQATVQSEQARQHIRADQQTYERAIADAQKAVAAAQAALDSADTFVKSPDAGRNGNDALQQGRAMLPTMPAYGTPLDAFVRLAAQAIRAQQFAEVASSAARARIMEVEAERAADMRRRQEAERHRREEQEAQWRRSEASRRASESSRSSSSWSSSSRSSSRSSSFGSSSRSSRSSSMGSSRRR